MRYGRPDSPAHSRPNISSYACADTVAIATNTESDAFANAVADGGTNTAANSRTIAVANATNPTSDAAPDAASVTTLTCPTHATANTGTAALSADVAGELAR